MFPIIGLSLRFYEMRKGLMFCLISNAHVSVEIFFCVTGILIARKKVRRRLVTVILGSCESLAIIRGLRQNISVQNSLTVVR